MAKVVKQFSNSLCVIKVSVADATPHNIKVFY